MSALRVLAHYYLQHRLDTVVLDVTAEWIPFWVVGDLAQQETELICHDIVAWRGYEFQAGCLPGVHDHHADGILDDEDITAIDYLGSAITKYLPSEQFSEGFGSTILNNHPLVDFQRLVLREESLLLLLLNQYNVVAGVN